MYICERTLLPYADARTLLSYDDGRNRLPCTDQRTFEMHLDERANETRNEHITGVFYVEWSIVFSDDLFHALSVYCTHSL